MYFIGAIFSVLFCLFSTILFISFSVLPGVGRERGAKLRKGGSFTIFHSYSFLLDIWRGATLQGRVHEESRKVSYIFLSFSFLNQVREEKEGQDWRYIFLHTYSSPSLSCQCKKRKRGWTEGTYSTHIPLLHYLTSVRRGRGAGLKVYIPPHIFLSFSILPV